MEVTHDWQKWELGFLIVGILISIGLGFVFVPIIRKAMNEEQ
jgi:hypothetical protein